MGEFESKLESILNDPQAMGKIMSLAQSLGGGTPPPAPSAGESPPPEAEPEESVPGGLDPGMLTGIASLLGQYNSGDDKRVALLTALRPYVKERQYAKVDQAIQIARLSRVIRMALGLLGTKEDGDV